VVASCTTSLPERITSTRITQVSITDLVIHAVKELAAQDGMTPLKIENRTRAVIYNNDMLPGIDCKEDVEPVTAGHNPTYIPRPQRAYNNELSTEAPIDSSKLNDLRADADAFLPARLPPTAPPLMLAMHPPPARCTPSPPPVTTHLGRSVCPVTRLTPAQNQVLTIPTPKQV